MAGIDPRLHLHEHTHGNGTAHQHEHIHGAPGVGTIDPENDRHLATVHTHDHSADDTEQAARLAALVASDEVKTALGGMTYKGAARAGMGTAGGSDADRMMVEAARCRALAAGITDPELYRGYLAKAAQLERDAALASVRQFQPASGRGDGKTIQTGPNTWRRT